MFNVYYRNVRQPSADYKKSLNIVINYLVRIFRIWNEVDSYLGPLSVA